MRRRVWQEELKDSYRTANDLALAGLIDQAKAAELEPLLAKYQFLLPRYYASLIEIGNPGCPIALQALPQAVELENQPGFIEDPLEDQAFKPRPRLTHRFKGRALVHLTSNCSMYCRFCFRKSLLNEQRSTFFAGELKEAFQYIEDHEIEEIIFSGGDPMMVSDLFLSNVISRLNEIKTLRRIRFHTRVPVTFPIRITQELTDVLKLSLKPVVIVCHFNHPKELTKEAHAACSLLKKAGFTLLNQSVLLNGVNDSTETLCALSRGLFSFGILPYYLHQLDRASGTAHFEVPTEKAKSIYRDMQSTLSGYLVPRFVQDVVGEAFKRSF